MKAHIRKERFPVHPKSMVGEVLNLYNDVDIFLKKNNQEICINQCYQCCYDYFYISIKEFYAIVHYCLEKKSSGYLETIIKEGIHQKEILKDIYPDEYARINTAYTFSQKMTFERMQDFNDHQHIKDALPIPCIFLNSEKKCDVYEVRPIICRLYGSACSSNPLQKQTLCNHLDSNKLADLKKFDIERIKNIDLVRGAISRPYPIMDWAADTLPSLLKNPQKLSPAWTLH